VIRYVTQSSFDAYLWQTVERKARFIAQVMRGTLDVRKIEDIGDSALSYAEVKALATGDPRILSTEAEAAPTPVIATSADEQTRSPAPNAAHDRVTTRPPNDSGRWLSVQAYPTGTEVNVHSADADGPGRHLGHGMVVGHTGPQHVIVESPGAPAAQQPSAAYGRPRPPRSACPPPTARPPAGPLYSTSNTPP
jgi:hypothetical protein